MPEGNARRTKNVSYLSVHGEDSRYDYSIDLRLHLRAKSAESAVIKAERIADFVTTKVPGVWLTVKRFKEKKR